MSRVRASAISRAKFAWDIGVAALVAAIAIPASAQVYKCVDRAGKTTYQQRACPEAQSGGRVDATPASGRGQPAEGDNADLAAGAQRKEIVVGMSRALVVQAVGTPQSMRPGTAQEQVAEVWVYKRPDLSALIGFNSGLVAWRRDNVDVSSAPAGEAGPTVRKAVAIGRNCPQIAAEIGSADSITERHDETIGGKAFYYVWEPRPDAPERTVAICLNGLVTRIERTPAP